MQPAKTERGVSGFRGISTAVKVLTAVCIIAFTSLLPRHVGTLYAIPFAGRFAPLGGLSNALEIRREAIARRRGVHRGIGSAVAGKSSRRPDFLSAIVKSNLCILTLLLLTWTTPFHELLQQLRRWHFPVIMLTTLALMYRYLPVLGEETRRMSRARASRTFSRRRWSSWSSLAEILGQLFIRTADRAERIYLAMCARGWK